MIIAEQRSAVKYQKSDKKDIFRKSIGLSRRSKTYQIILDESLGDPGLRVDQDPLDDLDLGAGLEVALVGLTVGRTSKCHPLRRVEVTTKKQLISYICRFRHIGHT